jgi:hypothetical protein
MREVTESDERELGVFAWICDRCKAEQQTLPDYSDGPEPAKPLAAPRAKQRKRSGRRDPLLHGIVQRWTRFEVRIPSGKGGKWKYIGLYSSIAEAIEARNAELRK